MDLWPLVAALNNARWCDAVCRSHGLPTRIDDNAWTCGGRSPMYYPDAVTLRADSRVRDVLTRIDRSPGCSLKDSYASTDLAPLGFDVLFTATWIRFAGTPDPISLALAWEPLEKAG